MKLSSHEYLYKPLTVCELFISSNMGPGCYSLNVNSREQILSPDTRDYVDDPPPRKRGFFFFPLMAQFIGFFMLVTIIGLVNL
jgi:hypothetical protein